MYQFTLKNDLNRKKESLRSFYFSQRGKYHRTIKSKCKNNSEKRKEKLWNLKLCSPKEFWRMLGSSNRSNNMNFDKTTLFEYFSNLLNTRESHTVVSEHEVSEEEFQTDENLSRLINDNLNCKITLDEVKTMIDKLKTGKASGIDLITAELLKGLNELFLTVFTQLFNKIYDSGDFPEEWAVRIIVLLFKGGNKSNLDNYRGITLLSIFGKLFLGVLLERLTTVLDNLKILVENQIAYRKGYQTSDQTFRKYVIKIVLVFSFVSLILRRHLTQWITLF